MTVGTWLSIIGILLIVGEVALAIVVYYFFSVLLARHKTNPVKWGLIWIAYVAVMTFVGFAFLWSSRLINFGPADR